MPDRHQARDTIERWAKVVAIAELNHTGMQGHAYLKWPGRAPHFALERALGFQCSRQRVRGTGKGRVEAIPRRVEDDTIRGSDRVAHQGIVVGKGTPHGRLVLFPQPGAAFDIGEEDRDFGGRHPGPRCKWSGTRP